MRHTAFIWGHTHLSFPERIQDILQFHWSDTHCRCCCFVEYAGGSFWYRLNRLFATRGGSQISKGELLPNAVPPALSERSRRGGHRRRSESRQRRRDKGHPGPSLVFLSANLQFPLAINVVPPPWLSLCLSTTPGFLCLLQMRIITIAISIISTRGSFPRDTELQRPKTLPC